MRTQAFLSATAILLACIDDIAATTTNDVVANSKLSAEVPDDIFVKSVPFMYGNITGKMVITIDKDSLHEVSTTASSSADVFNFTELDKAESASGDEDRGLFAFAATHFINYKVTSGVIFWVKKIF